MVAITAIFAVIWVLCRPPGLHWNSNQHKDLIYILVIWQCAQIHSIRFCLTSCHCYFMKTKLEYGNLLFKTMKGSLWPSEYTANPLTWLLLNKPFLSHSHQWPLYNKFVHCFFVQWWKNRCQRIIYFSNINPSVNSPNPTKIVFFSTPVYINRRFCHSCSVKPSRGLLL